MSSSLSRPERFPVMTSEEVDNIFFLGKTFVHQVRKQRTDNTNGVIRWIWIFFFPCLVQSVVVNHHLGALGNKFIAVKSCGGRHGNQCTLLIHSSLMSGNVEASLRTVVVKLIISLSRTACSSSLQMMMLVSCGYSAFAQEIKLSRDF